MFKSAQEGFQGVMGVLGDMPDEIRTKVIEWLAYPVPIESLVMTGEYLYHVRDQLPENVRKVAADFVMFRTENGFWGANEDNRGLRMVKALKAGTVKDGDPVSDRAFAPPVVASPLPTPVPPVEPPTE